MLFSYYLKSYIVYKLRDNAVSRLLVQINLARMKNKSRGRAADCMLSLTHYKDIIFIMIGHLQHSVVKHLFYAQLFLTPASM